MGGRLLGGSDRIRAEPRAQQGAFTVNVEGCLCWCWESGKRWDRARSSELPTQAQVHGGPRPSSPHSGRRFAFPSSTCVLTAGFSLGSRELPVAGAATSPGEALASRPVIWAESSRVSLRMAEPPVQIASHPESFPSHCLLHLSPVPPSLPALLPNPLWPFAGGQGGGWGFSGAAPGISGHAWCRAAGCTGSRWRGARRLLWTRRSLRCRRQVNLLLSDQQATLESS